jgi:aerobic-type carbon monoxide dehydrogenase small subunit (CoxS/CutS family)
MIETVSFTLNGRPVRVEADGGRPLLWVLRTDFGLTGAKLGCGEGYCGACTVLLDEEPVRSCQTTLQDVRGRSVRTIEGLAAGETLHPVQQAFVEHDALQCGFCTSGMILAAVALLRKKPRPTVREIQEGMEDNICRCGAHTRIVQAIQAAAEKMAAGGRR